MFRPVALAVTAAAALAACTPTPKTPATQEGDVPLGPYYIVGLGRDAVPTRNATLNLAPGQITGQGPCNTFVATNAATLPAIQITAFQAGQSTCRDSALESRYFSALQQASSAEYNGGVLVVKGPVWITYEAGTLAQ
ncbi:MAG: META domain-containing protein [Paracoccus sp. (in: a-proteobacteria)]|uniref:META domain-containing protein n=1 Tax=Paracoccus sp. TaxID=267 RepID=UPI0026DED514|nr:META domain-containing protein [Paracoccus sp. (in: a-proteobacteria)]MDO5612406.1 META domain-containing protein [Paracoccus sp. (in: a-proteobacteria)]